MPRATAKALHRAEEYITEVVVSKSITTGLRYGLGIGATVQLSGLYKKYLSDNNRRGNTKWGLD